MTRQKTKDDARQAEAIWRLLDQEEKWALGRLKSTGWLEPSDIEKAWPVAKPQRGYVLVKLSNDDMFGRMATSLVDLWPTGFRVIDGREYPWSDTVTNISEALRSLWAMRELSGYDLEDVERCARRYLSRFSTDNSAMLSLHNFILKERRDGVFIKRTSMLADMLEGINADDGTDVEKDMEGLV